MIEKSRTVYVLGAGFTKAFLPDAPLLKDYYDMAQLAERFDRSIYAGGLIDLERNRLGDGRIDIEHLLSRLDSYIPYDFERGGTSELALLRTEVLRMFVDRLNLTKQGCQIGDDLLAVARHCVSKRVTCITFNCDDFLDEALWKVAETDRALTKPNWHPDGGYGFYCRSSQFLVQDSAGRSMDATSMELLKLHGSLNWRVRRGHPAPYTIDSIVHHEPWLRVEGRIAEASLKSIEDHLQPEPFMIPPTLAKTLLSEQPILRLVWNKAFMALQSAEQVVFIGYSFPATDFAADVLLTEALNGLFRDRIWIVNYASTEAEKRELHRAYRSRLGNIHHRQFDFRGALEWARDPSGSAA